MKVINKIIKVKRKSFPIRIYEGDKPQYLIVTHHGILSNKMSWRYLEKWVNERAIVFNYDARVNGENKLRPSRHPNTYVRDLRDVISYAKKCYPHLPIITLGSSWGATVVISHAQKYGDTIFKAVAWSIPYAFSKGEDKTKKNKDLSQVENKEQTKIKETSKAMYAWKFFWMIFFNFNTKTYTKIDLGMTANNKALARINRLAKPKATPVKLFYSTWLLILRANKNIKKVNNKYEPTKLLYLQSTVDLYLKPKKLEELKKCNGQGAKLHILNEGRHAFQWEKENNLNERVFQIVWNWIGERD